MLEVQYSVAIGTMDRGMNMLMSFVVSQFRLFRLCSSEVAGEVGSSFCYHYDVSLVNGGIGLKSKLVWLGLS
jgi:hypothetical protein